MGEEQKGYKRLQKATPKSPLRKGSLSIPGSPSVRLEDVRRLLIEGRTPREIAAQYRLPVQGVHTMLKRRGSGHPVDAGDCLHDGHATAAGTRASGPTLSGARVPRLGGV